MHKMLVDQINKHLLVSYLGNIHFNNNFTLIFPNKRKNKTEHSNKFVFFISNFEEDKNMRHIWPDLEIDSPIIIMPTASQKLLPKLLNSK